MFVCSDRCVTTSKMDSYWQQYMYKADINERCQNNWPESVPDLQSITIGTNLVVLLKSNLFSRRLFVAAMSRPYKSNGHSHTIERIKFTHSALILSYTCSLCSMNEGFSSPSGRAHLGGTTNAWIQERTEFDQKLASILTHTSSVCSMKDGCHFQRPKSLSHQVRTSTFLIGTKAFAPLRKTFLLLCIHGSCTSWSVFEIKCFTWCSIVCCYRLISSIQIIQTLVTNRKVAGFW